MHAVSSRRDIPSLRLLHLAAIKVYWVDWLAFLGLLGNYFICLWMLAFGIKSNNIIFWVAGMFCEWFCILQLKITFRHLIGWSVITGIPRLGQFLISTRSKLSIAWHCSIPEGKRFWKCKIRFQKEMWASSSYNMNFDYAWHRGLFCFFGIWVVRDRFSTLVCPQNFLYWVRD